MSSSITNCWSEGFDISQLIIPINGFIKISECVFLMQALTFEINNNGSIYFSNDNGVLEFNENYVKITGENIENLIKDFSIYLLTYHSKILKNNLINFLRFKMNALYIEIDIKNNKLEILDYRENIQDNIDLEILFNKIKNNINKLVVLI